VTDFLMGSSTIPVTSCRILLVLLLIASSLSAILMSPSESACKDSPSITIDFIGPAEKSGIPAPWKLRVNEGTAYAEVMTDGSGPALYLRSSNSSFSLERELVLDVIEFPYFNWTWKALTIPIRGDLRKRSHNDQVLQILVAFDGGKIMSYVWDSNAPEGTITDESIGIPLFVTVKVIVVKTGISDMGKWLTMTRNIRDDYKKIFNEEPRKLRGIRVQTNSQYTGDCAEGLVKRLVFSKSLQWE
jgi:hypothetical protein